MFINFHIRGYAMQTLCTWRDEEKTRTFYVAQRDDRSLVMYYINDNDGGDIRHTLGC